MKVIIKKMSMFLLLVFFAFLFFNNSVNANNSSIYTFDYTGDYQEFVAPATGIYKLQTWGASGGNGFGVSTGGNGGYSTGYYSLTKGEKLYIYVGGQGVSSTSGVAAGGYNGGGNGSAGSSGKEAGGGGGATDIRLVSGVWNSSEGLDSRIIVAGGGAGGGGHYTTSSVNFSGGYGGGINGGSGAVNTSGSTCTPGNEGTQTEAGKNQAGYTTKGAFGLGGTGFSSASSGGGGGAGYYGGGGSYCAGGGGGSGYIGRLIPYLDNTPVTLSGNDSIPTQDEVGTITGNNGNGFAKITMINYNLYFSLDIKNATMVEEFNPNRFTYNVIITQPELETEITYILNNNIAVLGAGKVTLKQNTTKNIILVDELGMVTIYSFNIISAKAFAENIELGEAQFNFEPTIYEYSLLVKENISTLTPTITGSGTHEIIGSLNLNYGNNTFEIKYMEPGKEDTIYKFYVKRELDTSKNEDYLFSYTGDYQEFIAPISGYYKLEVWGAEGGSTTATSPGGRGGYSSGYYHLQKDEKVYIYIGGQGQEVTSGLGGAGFNGGGNGSVGNYSKPAAGGGGGTDIRLVSGAWNSNEGLNSRIIVAGGGGGGGTYYVSDNYSFGGGAGGGLSGLAGLGISSNPYGPGGTQSSSGFASGQPSTAGGFGYGGVGLKGSSSAGGGGGGYYGGGGSYCAGGGGGSGYIGKCLSHNGDEPITKNGTENIPTIDGANVTIGNTGAGKAKITIIEVDDSAKITDLSVSTGVLSPNFDKNIYEYNLIVENSVKEVTFSGLAENYEKISGLDTVLVTEGKTTHTITLINEYGVVTNYIFNIKKEPSSYKLLSGLEVSGVAIADFDPNIFEYTVTVTYDAQFVHINPIKGNDNQIITGDGIVTFNENETTKQILVVSENKEQNQLYTVKILREKSSKLKDIKINGGINFNFKSNVNEYVLTVSKNTYNFELEAIPYFSDSIVKVEGNKYFETDDKIIVTSSVSGLEDSVYTITINKEEIIVDDSFNYTGDYQKFVIPTTGYYEIETWGAGGGKNVSSGVLVKNNKPGYGGYSKGTILLKAGDELYIYVGGKGSDAQANTTVLGGYNGGGNGDHDHSDDEASGAGGGATDIRLVGGEWNSFDSLKSRIMVAGGGGGAAYTAIGGYGGGLIAGDTKYSKGGTQIGGYQFGIGQNGSYVNYNVDVGGGGGGYYGGYAKSSGQSSTYQTSGAGGSSYITGHNGSNSIAENSSSTNIIHTNNKIHYSNKEFTETTMIDGNGYLWTDKKTVQALMPNPTGGYFANGQGNLSNGAAKIKLLKETASNNFLDSLVIDDGNIDINFETWVTDYSVVLPTDMYTIKVDAIAKDSNAFVSGSGVIDILPGTNDYPVAVTSTNGDTKVYLLTITRTPSTNPNPKTIEINKMYSYLCKTSDIYCQYKFDTNTTYNVTVPFTIRDLELNTVLYSKYQSVIYRLVKGDEKTEINNNIQLVDEVTTIEVEVFDETKTQSIVYTYIFTKDITGNHSLSNIKITNPDIPISFSPNGYEYYLTIPGQHDQYDIEAVPENSSATVNITGNTNLVKGMNNCIITVIAPNGDTKTYVIHMYKEADSNVFLNELEIKNGEKALSLSPTFNKLLNDYQLNVDVDINEIDISAIAESSGATVVGTGVKKLSSGLNTFDIIVTSETGDSNIYIISIYKEKNDNSNLANIVVTDYELNEPFNPAIKEYYINIPKDINKLNITVTPETTSTKYTIIGNNNLNKITNEILINSIAENGSYQIYKIYATKQLSDNNYLKNINLSVGDLNEIFDRNQTEYSITLDNSVKQINIEGIVDDTSSLINGNGKYSLIVGENTVTLSVTNEIGDIKIYTIKITRAKNDDTSLKTITSNIGSEVIKVENQDYQYIINTQYEINSISINAIANATESLVTGNGNYSLALGNNDVILSVVSQAGTTTFYKIRIVRDFSENDDLKYLFIKEAGLSPVFKDTNIIYEVKVPNSVTKLTIDALTEDSNATYEVIGNSTLEVGIKKEIIVRVTAQKGNTKDYKLVVLRQEESTFDLTLDSLNISAGNLTPNFNKNTNIYEVSVYNNITSIELNGIATDANMQVIGNGIYSLNVGKNPLSIGVVDENGVTNYYQVIVNREKSSNASISNMMIKGSNLNPVFNSDITTYNIKTSFKKLEFTNIKTVEKEATYEIINNDNFTLSENIVIIRVTAPDGKTIKDYVLKVELTASTNNNLASLEVDGYILTPVFHKAVTTYTLTVDNSVNNIVVNAKAEDIQATISGLGSLIVKTGTNRFEVSVTSEAGTVKKYMIIVNKEGSNNNYISKLLLSNGELDQEFNKNILEYNVNVLNEISSIDIYGSLEDTNASTDGFKTYQLQVGRNSIEIPVISEDGDIRIYKINIVREELRSGLLEKLQIEGYELDTLFDKNIYEYFVSVNNETTMLNIIANPLEETANVTITGNENLIVGMNTITITVTSLDGVTKQEYEILVNRNFSANNYLNSITVSSGNLNPEFNPEKLDYTITVENNVSSIIVDATAQDSSSTITQGVGEHNLSVGTNYVTIKVKSSMGIYRSYLLTVIRKPSDNYYLTSLKVKANNNVLPFNQEFDKTTNEYSITVDSTTKYIEILGIKEDSAALINGTGIKELVTGSNRYTITVTSQSGQVNNYFITIIKKPSSNNSVTSITPNSGVLTPQFDNNIKEYTLDIEANQLLLSFDIILEDTKSVVVGNELMSIPDGNSERRIIITAENGDINTYVIKVIKQNTSVVLLESLELKNYPFTFDSNTFTYNISVSESKKGLLQSEITAVAKDSEAKINYMGDIILNKNNVNVYKIEVIAKDGYTTQEYTLNITRDNIDKTITSSNYDINRFEDSEDYVIGVKPDTNLTDFIASFNNESVNIKVYKENGDLLTSGIVGTGMTVKLEINGFVYDELRIIIRGDLTGDGKVNIQDKVRINSHITKTNMLENWYFIAGDTTKDNTINIQDKVKLNNFITKNITDLD